MTKKDNERSREMRHHALQVALMLQPYSADEANDVLDYCRELLAWSNGAPLGDNA